MEKEIKTIEQIKKEIALECVEEHFEVIFEAEIMVGDFDAAERLWNEVGKRYINQFKKIKNESRGF
jgi:CxxC motif-containing protein